MTMWVMVLALTYLLAYRQGDTPANPPDAAPVTTAAGQGIHHPEEPEPAAVAARPAEDCSRPAHRKGLLNGSLQPTQGGRKKGEDLAGEKTAAHAIARVFGEDSSSSSAGNSDEHGMPGQQVLGYLEPPAPQLGKGKALSRDAMNSNKVGVHEAAVLPRAKRKAAIAEQEAEHAGGARPRKVSVTASEAAKSNRAGRSAFRSKGSSGKPAVKSASMRGQRKTRPSEKADLDQTGADAVDWKAYADALNVRIAEAEALLADDSK